MEESDTRDFPGDTQCNAGGGGWKGESSMGQLADKEGI